MRVVEPGGQVTLFPDNVVTSAEVQGIELPAIKCGRAGPKGPFAANPPGTLASEIAIDILLPKGCSTRRMMGRWNRLAPASMCTRAKSMIQESRLVLRSFWVGRTLSRQHFTP